MAYLQSLGVSIERKGLQSHHTRSAILMLIVRYAIISAVLLWRRLPRAELELVLLGIIWTVLPVNIRMVAAAAGLVDIRSFAVVEGVRSCVEVCKLLVYASAKEAMMFLRIVVWLGWVLLRRWSSISSVVSRSWVS